jgi:hypothetical protein
VEVLKSWHQFLQPTRRVRSSRGSRHLQQVQHVSQSSGYAVVESVERRTLFSLSVAAQAFSPGVPQLVFTDIANGQTNGTGATAAQSVTITNTGGAAVSINSASIIDDPSTSGDGASQFQNTGFASGSIAPGASASFAVKLQAGSIGVHGAILRIQTTDPNQPTVDVALRGIGTASDGSGSVGGDKEPSLQRILNAFQIPVNVGDADGEGSNSFPTPRPGGTANDEVSLPRLVKSGSGPVIIQALAAYQFNNGVGPSTHFGFYSPGTPDAKTELFQVALGSSTSTSLGNNVSFDPGSSPFSLYDTFNGSIFEDANKLPRTAYSEDMFNTWATHTKQKFRFFPLKNKDGSVVPDAFVFTTEDFDGNTASAFDNNDVVGVIRNVKAAPAGPEVGSAALDRGMLPTQLAFNRIQEQPPTTVDLETGEEIPLPNNVVHDKATVRIHNSGTSTLTISSVTLSNTTDFKINTTGLTGKTIAPGASTDIEVQFIATGGRIKTGTLAVNTNDADEGAYSVKLTGYWQQKSEHDREPSFQEIVQLAGLSTNVGTNTELATGGKVSAVGDEVLSGYWRAADPAQSVEVIQLGAWHTHNQEESIKWYSKGSNTTTTVFTHAALSGQSFLPNLKGSTTAIAAGTFKVSSSSSQFGFKVQNEWSDDTKNVQENAGGGWGHHMRFFPAKDAAGKVIPNTYVMGMDYLSINFDYQDNVYLIRNIMPAEASAAPAAPTGLAATGSDAGVALNWSDNAASGLAGYNVYRGTSADFTPGAGNRLNGSLLSSSEFNDTTAPVGVQSFYKVTAVNTSGAESSAASASATRTGQVQTPPATPTGFAASGITSSSITLSWGAVTGASKYVLGRRLAGTEFFTTVSDSITAATFTDTGLTASTAYEYQLTAVGTNGLSSTPTAALPATTAGVTQPGLPIFSSDDPSVTEPTNGTANMTFTLSLSAASSAPVSIDYTTINGSALAGNDFTATSGSITFAPGQTTKTIVVPILSDSIDEAAETFGLTFTLTGGNVTVSDGAATATILPASSTPTPTPTTPTPTPTGTPIAFGGKTVANVLGQRIALKGPGNGTATVLDGNVVRIDVTGSTAASSLNITGKGGAMQLADVTVNGSLRSFTGKNADLLGNVNVTGTLGKLTAHDTHNARTLTIGGSAVPVSIALASANDLSVNSASPIKSIKAAAWLDTDNTADTISTPALSSLAVTGNMAADIVTGLLGKVSVRGAITGATIRSNGDIASVRAGAIQDSAVYAGVRSDLTGMPSAAGDFTGNAIIRSLSVSGKNPGAFSDSVIAAADLGKVSLGSVTTTNGGTSFGLAADRIASVSSTLGGGSKLTLKKLDDPADSQTQDDFTLRLT